jgi:hypothetical protein
MRKVGSLVLAGVLALALASPAAADTTGGGGPGEAYSDGMTITITSARVVAKVLVAITVDVTCDAAPKDRSWEDNWFTATVRQASGRAIATGWVEWGVRDPDALCDGDVHPVTVTIPAEGVPFKGGMAAMGVTGYAGYYHDWCDDSGCYQESDNVGASTGWVTVKLGR